MKWSLQRTVTATEVPLTLAEARMQLRVDVIGSPPTNPEDDLITRLVRQATEELDAGTGWLGRAICPQTWALALQSFPFGDAAIYLPYPPLMSVLSVVYYDPDGAPQSLTEGVDFRVLPSTVGTGQARLKPTLSTVWPKTLIDDEAVFITFRCGFSDQTVSPIVFGNCPEAIPNYIRARLTELYDTRGVTDNAVSQRNEMLGSVPNALTELRYFNYSPLYPCGN